MQKNKTNISFLLFFSLMLLISCNEPATTSEKNDKDTTKIVAASDTNSLIKYDRALDPLITAGANAKLLQDSLGIKIFEVWVKPGELAPIHKHPDHAIYVLEGGKAMVYSKDFPGGEKGIAMEFKPGEGWVGGPVTDSARNIGTTTIRLLEIDVYRPRNK